MQASVTVPMAAQADEIWNIVADVRNTGKYSPEVIEAEWLDGATGPALGARFRGHVRRNEIGPVYWNTCLVSCGFGKIFSGARRLAILKAKQNIMLLSTSMPGKIS